MIEFTKKLMITGAEQRTNKSTNNTYILVHVMGENGVTISCMYKGDANKIMNLKKMQTYEVTFSINVSQYTHLNVLDINDCK